MLQCPGCKSEKLRKEGSITRWKDRKPYQLQRYRCKDCGFLTTRPLNGDNPSKDIPPAVKHPVKCLKCGYQWESVKIHPTRCANPKCRSPYWDKGKGE